MLNKLLKYPKKMKNYIIVTGGSGFIGTNLIKELISKTNFKIISIDDYSSGSKKNHINNHRISYVRGHTKNISIILKKYHKKIHLFFHFGEFSRIVKSFEYRKKIINSNLVGSANVIEFCLTNKIEIIYSCTSAGFGNNFEDQNLSPYSYLKSVNLNLIINYATWFGLKYKVLYFYNVYGGNETIKKEMKAVIGIFEDCKKKNLSLPIVRPGTQNRIFTDIKDVIKACLKAVKTSNHSHFIIRAKKSYKIIEIAKLFQHKYHYIPSRTGERFTSSFVKKIRGNNIKEIICKNDIKNYLKNKYFLK